jgi:hypothetical protein
LQALCGGVMIRLDLAPKTDSLSLRAGAPLLDAERFGCRKIAGSWQ